MVESLFVQVTLAPADTVSVSGENAKFWITTAAVVPDAPVVVWVAGVVVDCEVVLQETAAAIPVSASSVNINTQMILFISYPLRKMIRDGYFSRLSTAFQLIFLKNAAM